MKHDNINERRARKWFFGVVVTALICLLFFAIITICIDPFFHYHKPLKTLAYSIDEERYQNDGIIRLWDYDAIITGSSMTENFKASQFDELFNCNSIKVAFSGGTYKEVGDNLRKALETHTDKKIKYVLRSLDYSTLVMDKNAMSKNFIYPEYITNDKWLDDVNYILNKDALLRSFDVLRRTKEGKETTTFDEYKNWNGYYKFGKASVLKGAHIPKKAKQERRLTDADKTMILNNIRQNVTDLADEYPDTTFYLFFPPYSICYWAELYENGTISWRIEAEEVAICELLKHPNIKLYSFCTNYDMVCDLDNYKDTAHYGEWINDKILEWIAKDEYLLTPDNYQSYIDDISEFYNSFKYRSFYKKNGVRN